jgi:hypothetical protein
MPSNDNLHVCPVCQGQGQVRRSELSDLFTGDGLRTRIIRCLAANDSAGDEEGELATAGVREAGSRDFQKDVHNWNPQLPIWRRSPKE